MNRIIVYNHFRNMAEPLEAKVDGIMYEIKRGDLDTTGTSFRQQVRGPPSDSKRP